MALCHSILRNSTFFFRAPEVLAYRHYPFRFTAARGGVDMLAGWSTAQRGREGLQDVMSRRSRKRWRRLRISASARQYLEPILSIRV
jgi:hypothetical protein